MSYRFNLDHECTTQSEGARISGRLAYAHSSSDLCLSETGLVGLSFNLLGRARANRDFAWLHGFRQFPDKVDM